MTYDINININALDGVDQQDAVSNGSNVNGKGNGVSAGSPSELEKAQKQLGNFIVAQTIEPFLQNVKTQITQNIEIATGNNDLQERVNFAFEVAEFGVGTYKNASAGSALAIAMGVSGGVGALIGVGLTVLNTMMQVAFNAHKINLEKRMENYQLQQVRDRQGVIYNKSRR